MRQCTTTKHPPACTPPTCFACSWAPHISSLFNRHKAEDLKRVFSRTSGRYTTARFEQQATKHSNKLESVTPPAGRLDVDQELWQVLDLATDEELETIYNILYGASLLSPLLKSLIREQEPAAIHYRGRAAVMHRIEARLRFLAADAQATLKGRFPSYREVLLCIHEKLELSCPSTLVTQDLESEIFLHLVEQHNRTVVSKGSANNKQPCNEYGAEGDGMVPEFSRPDDGAAAATWLDQLTRSLRLGGQELVPTLAKFTSAVTVSSVRNATLRELGAQLVAQHARHEAALSLLCKGSSQGVAALQRRAAVQSTQKGLTLAAARYSAVQGALAMVGPAMWAWLGIDLALKAIGTDYSRVVQAVYALAQIRLLRTYGFSGPGTAEPGI